MAFSETDISLLLSSELLRGLPESRVFEEVFRCCENQLCLAADTVFLQAGTERPGLHLIAHGTVEMLVATSDGAEKIVEFARTGGMFAEETLFDAQPLRYTVRTLTAAAIFRVPEQTVDAWLSASPGFSHRLMAGLAARTDYLQKDMVTFCTKNATARLVCYLVCQFDKAPATPDGSLLLNIALPRNKLASRLGVSDSHLSRAFRELEDKGLIVKQRNGIFIPNVPALSAYVCPSGCDW
ncbi:MAG: Crp/Fnr family transcriptional regulator [Betaproteobacteria bacterium]|uniref:Crp/Fnr family transcriptional regulator n=1 Tax=Candidatus Proximibacter danicus TaxID=2954365 RepID=A0A9D7JYG6_9PROT|nr:Crp/Fnr family transcriptional regulator [Candidatus Proximibacter danicus]MBK9446439.1 Crp/Fnr family transcriptional regulator [Betaproteobacteria bacterium]